MTPGGLGPLRARSHTSLSTLIVCSCATMSGRMPLDLLLLNSISFDKFDAYWFMIKRFCTLIEKNKNEHSDKKLNYWNWCNRKELQSITRSNSKRKRSLNITKVMYFWKEVFPGVLTVTPTKAVLSWRVLWLKESEVFFQQKQTNGSLWWPTHNTH